MNIDTWKVLIIMHKDRRVATIRKDGSCTIYTKSFLPYNLYLEPAKKDSTDYDTRINNLSNFYHWCASRVLTLDRVYAKEILNSIGATQATTDKDRAGVALSYRCLSLQDVYWVRGFREQIKYTDINLYQNSLSKQDVLVDVSLSGKQATVTNAELLADDLSTVGVYPKAWIRKSDTFYLLKGGDSQAVNNEILASKVARCFKLDQVYYEREIFNGEVVSKSKLVSSLQYSLVPLEYYRVYAVNRDLEVKNSLLGLDAYNYYMMNIIDYLIGNTDRHLSNWGVLVDNTNNKPVKLYPLMDFNKAFNNYDIEDGASCLTVLDKSKVTQKEAAIEAVKKVGLNQINEIDMSIFKDIKVRDMFIKRLSILKKMG